MSGTGKDTEVSVLRNSNGIIGQGSNVEAFGGKNKRSPRGSCVSVSGTCTTCAISDDPLTLERSCDTKSFENEGHAYVDARRQRKPRRRSGAEGEEEGEGEGDGGKGGGGSARERKGGEVGGGRGE